MTGPEVTQPDPDGGVEMTDGEWAAFRGVEVTAAMKAEDVPTSEVARVLIEHTRIDGIHGDCLCKHVVPLGHSFAAHQAEALAEAGLLRDYAVNVHESCNRELGNALAMAQEAQIATQEPAGATQGGSGDSRASGGLGERLRALGTGQTRTLRKVLRAMADEADRLEEALRSTTHQLELEQDDVCVAHGTVRPCRHCAYAAAASEGTW